MKLPTILYISFALLLGACHKTPPIRDHVIEYPSQTRTGINYVANGPDLRCVAWWKQLHDPLLEQLVSQALAANNTIKSANATILEAKAQFKSAQYTWLPTLDGSAEGIMARTWATHIQPQGALASTPFVTNLSHLRFKAYNAGFIPNYSLNIMKNVYRVKSACASLALQQAQAQNTKLSIISQMTGAYFMLLSQQTQLKLQQKLVNDLKKLRTLEADRFKNGASDIERVTTLDQTLAQEEMKIPQIESVIAQNENTIHLLLNQNPGPIHNDRSLDSLSTINLIPKNIPSSVLRNRPDILIALNEVRMEDAEYGVATSAFFPTINLTGILGKASLDLSHLLKLSTAFWIAEALTSTKILNASAYQDIKAAKAKYYAAYFNYLQTLKNAFADVDNHLTNLQNTRKAYLLIKRGYRAAQKTHSIALNQYKAGWTDYRNVANALITVDRYELTLVQEKAQLLDNVVQVYTALAGGYEARRQCELPNRTDILTK